MQVLVSFTPLVLYPWRESPQYPSDMRLRGPQMWSGCCEEKNLLPLLGIETKFLGHPACSPPLNRLSYPSSTTINKTCTNLNMVYNNKTIWEVETTKLHSWNWAFLEKLSIVQLLKNFPAFYGTRRFITVFTRTLHWALFWARSIQYIPSPPISLRSILILSTHQTWSF
jgi:hypothetical protein